VSGSLFLWVLRRILGEVSGNLWKSVTVLKKEATAEDKRIKKDGCP
jgi:hypothetical protein